MSQPTTDTPPSFFQSLFQKRHCNRWLFSVILILSFGFSAHVRFQQYETWKKSPASYFVGERPMMTTLDAPYFLRIAREYREGTYGQKQGLAIYPDQTSWLREQNATKDVTQTEASAIKETPPPPEISFKSIPMLSFLVAKLVPFFDGNYYKAGTLLVPIFASLFILPLGIYFFLAGYPAAGILGAMIATFCAEYYMRSSIGRIDTDMLNLFFPALSSLCVLLAYRAKKDLWALAWSAISGASLYVFLWWYNKPAFLLAYLGVLAVVLFLRKTSIKIFALSIVAFILFAGTGTFMASYGSLKGAMAAYWNFGQSTNFQTANNTENKTESTLKPVSFPNVMNTISEAQKAPMAEIPTHVLNDSFLGWTGLLTFLIFIGLRWKETIPLLPMILLGLMAFRSARRFIMYLAPFVGIGFGMLITLSVTLTWEQLRSLFSPNPQANTDSRYGKKRKKKKKEENLEENVEQKPETWFRKQSPLLKEVAVYAGAALFFVAVSGKTAISFVPGPSIPTSLYAKFLDFKKILPKNAALLTWWDYGYALTDATGFATFHDGGGSQFSNKTYFIARGLVGDSQVKLHNIIRFIATEGNAGITKANTSNENLIKTIQNPERPFHDPVYLLFTVDMIGKFSAISAIGTWDFETKTKTVRGFQRLQCTKIVNNVITCQNLKIDIAKGTINGRIPLRRLVQVLKGKVVGEKSYNRSQGHTLQIIMASSQQFSDIFLVEEKVYQSNFNQLYLLGRYDPRLYTEVYNSFPATRMFRVNDVRANDGR